METVVTSIRITKAKLKETEKRAKRLKMSRNEYIDKAIEELNKKIEEMEWDEALKKACAAEREARKTDDIYQLAEDSAGYDLPEDSFDWDRAYGIK
jgi:metal-responsive CopG/Arc/MetJ family transcriptional regulator